MAFRQKIGFAAGVLILAQRHAVLVAKQAACLDELSGGRFRLGVGVGWNKAEFDGLNENFSNRGKRSEEQVRVMQALWAEPHVQFTGEFHRLDDAGINPRPASGRVPIWFGGHAEATVGLEVWVSPGIGTEADWRREIAFWKAAGVTHVTAHTTYDNGHHTRIAVITRYRAAVADLL